MTPDEEIKVLRSCVRLLWRGMKPTKIHGQVYWTEGGKNHEHVGCLTISDNETSALSRAFEGLPRNGWPYNELTPRGIPEPDHPENHSHQHTP